MQSKLSQKHRPYLKNSSKSRSLATDGGIDAVARKRVVLSLLFSLSISRNVTPSGDRRR